MGQPYFKPGDVIYYGKWKNKRGKIVCFSTDRWGDPTVEIEPIPRGRKKNKVFGLYRIWRADIVDAAKAKLLAKPPLAHVVVARYLGGLP